MVKKRAKQAKVSEKASRDVQRKPSTNTKHLRNAWIDDSTLIMQLVFLVAALVLLPRPTSASTITDLLDNPISLFLVLHSEGPFLLACVGVAVVQTWYGTYLRRQRIQTELEFSKKEENSNAEKAKQLTWQAIKDAVAVTALSTVVLHAAIVLLGAPLFTMWRRTLLLSFHLALLTVLPLAWTLPAPWRSIWTWKRLLSMFLPNGSMEKRLLFPLIGGWVGAYVGGATVLFDWNRDWQKWPVPSIVGIWIGYVLASVYAVATAR